MSCTVFQVRLGFWPFVSLFRAWVSNLVDRQTTSAYDLSLILCRYNMCERVQTEHLAGLQLLDPTFLGHLPYDRLPPRTPDVIPPMSPFATDGRCFILGSLWSDVHR